MADNERSAAWKPRWEEECPLFVGVTFSGWEAGSDAQLSDELKRIRDTGFETVRVHFDRDNDIEKSVGMVNWRNSDRFFDKAEQIGLRVLAVPGNCPHRTIAVTPDSFHLSEQALESIGAWIRRFCGQYRLHPALFAWIMEAPLGAQQSGRLWIHPSEHTLFSQWLQTEYPTLEALNRAWKRGAGPHKKPGLSDYSQGFTVYEASGASVAEVRDLKRFEAAVKQKDQSRILDFFRAADPNHPVLTSNRGLLGNMAYEGRSWFDSVGVDREIEARRCDMYGLDMRMDRDFEAVQGEIDRPSYIVSRLAADLAADTLPVVSHCVVGTSRYTGDRAFTLKVDTITRLLLTFLAAGMKGMCLAHWRFSQSGSTRVEGGLLDWLDRVTPSTQRAGQIALAVQRYHQELWRSHMPPHVHILGSWSNDAFAYILPELEEVTGSMEDHERNPAMARIGAARALLNANVPFAFLTDRQLLDGTVSPAPILFLPWMETLSEPLLKKLADYANSGGRVVADMPCGYLNNSGELLDTKTGSAFEQLFGASVAGLYCFSSANLKDAEPARGQQRADLVITTAKSGGVSSDGIPGFTENHVGKGRAILINYSLSRLCASPALSSAQLSLLSYILGKKQTSLPATSTDGCLTFRRTDTDSEHVFLINDSSEDRTLEVSVPQGFTDVRDAIDEALLTTQNAVVTVKVPGGAGLWLRLAK